MPRKPAPWFWEQRNLWCVNIARQRHVLGEHPNGSPRPKKNEKTGLWNVPKEIDDTFHELMSSEKPKVSGDAVVVILDDFITWCSESRAKKTTDRYRDFIQSFVLEHGRLAVSELDSSHVTIWLNEQETWNSTTKRNAITALMRGFNWAVKNRGLKYNPIKGMEKPKAQTRTTIVTPEEFTAILEHVTDQPFQDLLVLSYDTGSRPQEIKGMEARMVDLEKQMAVITADDGAKGGITRAIYFPTERSMEIIRRLVKEHPTGPLLLNTKGNRWTGFAVKCRFEKLEKKLGKRYTHYSLRHTFVTRKLVAGVDSHVVAKLAGHSDTKMIDSVYSHVAQDHQFMLDEAKKGEGEED